MKSVKNTRPVVVGIFILVGLAILVLAVFSLGGQKKTFVKGITLNTVFDDVSGLQSGNNVWLSGVKIGTIKKTTFLPNAQILVTMTVQKSLEPMIRKDSKTKISSDGLIGNKIVVIFGGTQAAPAVKDNDYLTAQKALSTEDMLVTLQANNKNLLAITGSFKSISNKIDSGTGMLGMLLNNADLSKKVSGSVDELQKIMSNFEVASARSKEVLSNLNNFTAKLNKPGSFANDIVTDTSIFNNLRGTISQLKEVANKANSVTDNLQNATAGLRTKNTPLGILLNDVPTGDSLKQVIYNLRTGTQTLNEDLEALQHNFLLRGYFKRKSKQEQKQ